MANAWSHDLGFCVDALVCDDLNEEKLKDLLSNVLTFLNSNYHQTSAPAQKSKSLMIWLWIMHNQCFLWMKTKLTAKNNIWIKLVQKFWEVLVMKFQQNDVRYVGIENQK